MDAENPSGNNGIWSSIDKIGSQAIDAYKTVIDIRSKENIGIAQANANAWTAFNASRAAPGGVPSNYSGNTPPGQFSTFPQAQGTPQPGASAGVNFSAIGSTINGYVVAFILVIAVFAAGAIALRR
jgi:hypothetical protein